MGRLFGSLKTRATLPIFDIEMSRPEILRALDYVSERLSRRAHHMTLIVTGAALSCLHLKTISHCSNISIIPACPLTPAQMSSLATAAKKAAKKFNLGADWLHNRDQTKLAKLSYLKDITHASLLQNDVIYSTEGLTLLSVEYTYALKVKLAEISHMDPSLPTPSSVAIDDAICMLNWLVTKFRGRPIPKGYLKYRYPRIEISDSALLRLSSMYIWKYSTRGLCGVNDEWLEWRREGRYDLDWDFRTWELRDDKSSILSSQTSENGDGSGGQEKEQIGEGVEEEMEPYALDFGFREMDSNPSTRACTPAPVLATRRRNYEVEQFLQAFNISI